MNEIKLHLAFTAGLLSFFSPCVLPLIPSYIVYITGTSIKDIKKPSILLNSLFFILGFSAVFVLMGSAASWLGQILLQYRSIIRLAGGLVIIIFGLYVMEIFRVKLFDVEKRFNIAGKPSGYFGSVTVGAAFAAAWTPCIGPILGSILILAGTESSLYSGVVLLSAYSIGLAIPFMATALLLAHAVQLLNKIQKFMWAIKIISGMFLLALGILLLIGWYL